MPELDRAERELLQELLCAYGPGGHEDAVRAVCRRELDPVADETWVDAAGNLIGRFGGDPGRPAVRVLAHMDELAMLVKRIGADGCLHLTPLGTMYPANFGLGPVAILGRYATITGVLALGSEHTTAESPRIWRTKPGPGGHAMDWPDVYVFTGRTAAELTECGVRPGTRVCVDASKRTLVEFAGHLGCYFMDDRACVTALLMAARRLRARRTALPAEVYLVFTTNEEVGGVGGSYAARTLPGDITVALEVGPTEAEYTTTVEGGPIVAYSDAQCVYDTRVADRLMDIATERGLHPQAAVLGAFESDASHAKASGLSARAGMLCLPTLSTHGYEVIARPAIPAMTEVIVEYLTSVS